MNSSLTCVGSTENGWMHTPKLKPISLCNASAIKKKKNIQITYFITSGAWITLHVIYLPSCSFSSLHTQKKCNYTRVWQIEACASITRLQTAKTWTESLCLHPNRNIWTQITSCSTVCSPEKRRPSKRHTLINSLSRSLLTCFKLSWQSSSVSCQSIKRGLGWLLLCWG